MPDNHPTLTEALDIAERLKTWDMLDATADGPYVRRQLDQIIAAIRAVKFPAVTCINCGHRMEAFFRDGKQVR